MTIIGRKDEQIILQEVLDSHRSEFVVVYGRRRVGKTFLIKEFFENTFSFYATGVDGISMSEELGFFEDSLKEYGDNDKGHIKSWREAFSRLRKLLMSDKVARDPISKKRVIFLDELPWMDTAKSNFKPALDHFWNSWASSQDDIVLIVCGSATSWIIGNILTDKGGFYNRITRRIHLMPFTLRECQGFLESNDIRLSRDDIIHSYMVFGGIPYYLGLLSRRLSLAQNIDSLLFNKQGQLYYEYRTLFKSLFKNSEKHISIIKALGEKRVGLTRKEIIKCTKIADGGLLTKALEELEQCGFIRKYKHYAKASNSSMYQIIDPFVLFCQTFIDDNKTGSWMKFIRTPAYNAWCGLAFEMLCLNHVGQIKDKLGISGIESNEFSWKSSHSKPGAQIDLVIDRADNVINICEMKYSTKEYVIDSEYYNKLENKLSVFAQEANSKSALHLTMICMNGLARNEYSSIVVSDLSGEDLFFA